jgi:carboxyl-terminal processing protease
MNPQISPQKIYQLVLVVVLVAGAFFVGQFKGTQQQAILPIIGVINPDTGKPADVDFAQFWQVWNILHEKHVSGDVIDGKKKVYGAIQGLAASYGDPYTVFFPPEESKMFQSEIAGNFEGVGMEVGIKDEVLTVISPLKGAPAERAGLQAGDRILQIDDVTTQNMSVDQAIERIRGKKGTVVTFFLSREGVEEPFTIKVTRDTIDIPIIETEKDKDVFIIRLYSFTANSPQLFRNALREFVLSGSDKLVLDLRGNPGGYLEAAVDMASWFLPEGATIVTEDFSGKSEQISYTSKGYNIFNKGLKMAILVDKGSASASEILAGALAEEGVAVLVGTQTFGKGSVQELIPIDSDTSLKITVAKWVTPKGTSISDGGLKPDHEIAVTAEQIAAKDDVQLAKALEVLRASTTPATN